MYVRNVGTADRGLRVALGVALIAGFFATTTTGSWAWLALVMGAVSVITGALGTCGIYSLLGVSTCKAE